MGIAAYNRGSKAISDHITQQSRQSKLVKTPERMWRPPKGWFQAAIQARQDLENMQARIDDNERRRNYGLPTYEV